MKRDSLFICFRLMIVGVAVCGLIVYAGVIPMLGADLAARYPEFSGCRWPWLALIWATAVPCFIALALAWRIAVNIGADRSFTAENARLLRGIGLLAAADALGFFAGNLLYLLLGINHPAIVLISLLVVFLGAAIAVAAATLSRLVFRAAELQEQSDLTI